MMTRERGNIYRIQVPLPGNPLQAVNSYCVLGKERTLLIDTGFRAPESRSALLGALAELGVDMDAADIFLTHAHADHAGLAPHIAGAGTKIFVSEADMRRLNSAREAEAWAKREAYYRTEGFPPALIENHIKHNPVRTYAPGPSERYCPVEEGQVLEYGGYRLRCIATPGHSPGHLCLYDAERALLFSGDHILFDITPNITSWVGFDDALGHYLDSLKKLLDLPVEQTLPGHRAPGQGIQARIQALLRHHETRLQEALELVRREPGQTAYALAGKMSWRMRCRSWADFPPNQKWFAVGETLSHLDLLVKRGAVRRLCHGDMHTYEAI